MKIKEEEKIKIKNYINLNIKGDNLISKKDISFAVRRLLSRYLSGKRSDTDINEYQKLINYIIKEDLWRAELLNDKNINNFEKTINKFFEGIRNEINLEIKCNNKENKCEFCEQKKENKNICHECNNCNYGLRIGHSFEFLKIIN